MRIVNSFIKALGYAGIYLLTFIQGYGLSMVFTPFPICLVLSIMSLIKFGMPDWLKHKFFLAYLIACIPLGIAFSVIITVKAYKRTFSYKKLTPESIKNYK